MAAPNYTYPDKLGYGETLMFHLRVMSSEIATDGLDNEFEDLVDMLGWMVWPYMDAKSQDAWDEASENGLDLSREREFERWGIAKRERCEAKMRLAMNTLNANGLLLKKVPEFNPEKDYLDIPVEGVDGD